MGVLMNKLFELKFGSHLYGTDTVNSDLDLKAIYIPEPKEILLGKHKKTISTCRSKAEFERNTKDDIDIEIFSLDRYVKLLTEGQTVALDVLFAPMNMYTSIDKDLYWIFSNLYNHRDKLISKDLTAFVGYAKQQAAKYGLKGFRVAALRESLDFISKFQNTHDRLDLYKSEVYKFVYEKPCLNPTLKNPHITIEMKKDKVGNEIEYLKVCDKYYEFNCRVKDIKDRLEKRFDQYGQRALKAEKNEGIDWKALSHAVRVNSQGIELLETGKITFPRPDKDLLLDIKTGKMEYNQVADIITEGLENLTEAQKLSNLRSKPDLEWADDFVADIYAHAVIGTL
jgi:predicted nucleotidyltransferase